tara:strand:- start:1622 stop:2260 length:639 start_codon:yes stop_codon:yes gene_type:complete
MEAPELRVGGWEKEGRSRWFKRLFSLILIALLAFLIIGPSLIEYQNAEPGDSMYLDTGVWNGPFEIDSIKEFNGHLKIITQKYETTDGKSGKLVILSISSLVNLESQISGIVVDKVKLQASDEGLTLVGDGVIANEVNEELHPSATIYQWDAKVEKSNFFNDGEDIIVKTIFWTPYKGFVSIDGGFQTIVCIAFGTNQATINQAVEIVENIN